MENLNFLIVTETGLARKDNQDCFFASEKKSVFCVADGVGGGCAGAEASSIVCEEIEKSLQEKSDDIRMLMENGILAANRRIRQHAHEKRYSAMGSTIAVVAFVGDDARRAEICHVGDSRVYRLKHDKAVLLTDDHTLANRILNSGEAQWAELLKNRKSPLSHILTKAIGADEQMSPEWKTVDVETGDCFFVCSDGVHDVIDDEELFKLFISSNTIEEFSRALKTEISRCGAPDNFTYIIIKIGK